jgi:hypothetical protein
MLRLFGSRNLSGVPCSKGENSSRTQHSVIAVELIDRFGLIDAERHFAIFDFDNCHYVLADLNHIANDNIEFLTFHCKPP